MFRTLLSIALLVIGLFPAYADEDRTLLSRNLTNLDKCDSFLSSIKTGNWPLGSVGESIYPFPSTAASILGVAFSRKGRRMGRPSKTN